MSARPLPERFWEKVDKSAGSDGCWPWIGGFFQSIRGFAPYGRFMVTGQDGRRAHRFAYELTHGKIRKGAVIRHTCDNPSCCNPRHLLSGTSSDNVLDRVERGRTATGETHGLSKLSKAAVATIRSSSLSNPKIAKQFGISRHQAWAIRTKKAWSHL